MSGNQSDGGFAAELPLAGNENLSELNAELMKLVMGNLVSEVIHVAVQLNLAGLFKDRASATDEELAGLTGTGAAALYRLLRVLVSVGILEEIAPHRFGLTPKGQLLQEGVPGSVYTTALFFGSPRARKIWENLLYSVQTGKSANQHAFGVPTWQYYAEHPEEAPIFYNFMTESSNQITPSLTTNYNFEGLKVVADIGGAQGNMLAAVLKANPHLKGILFDLPQVTRGARQHLEKEGVAERCQIVGGDMFAAWPFKADLYIISRVLENWSDEKAIAILKNCREAMEANSKVVLVERILPEDRDRALLFYLFDLQMLVGPGGQDHTLAEYEEFFQAANLRFTRSIALHPPFSLIEAVKV
jgi:hypothetical protein